MVPPESDMSVTEMTPLLYTESAEASVSPLQKALAPAGGSDERSDARSPPRWLVAALRHCTFWWPVVHAALAFINVFTPTTAVRLFQFVAAVWLLPNPQAVAAASGGAERVQAGTEPAQGEDGRPDGPPGRGGAQVAPGRWRVAQVALLALLSLLNFLFPILAVRLGLLAVSVAPAVTVALAATSPPPPAPTDNLARGVLHPHHA